MQNDDSGDTRTTGIISAIKNLGGAYRYTVLSDTVASVESEWEFALNERVGLARDGEAFRISPAKGEKADCDRDISAIMRGLSIGQRVRSLAESPLSGNPDLDVVARKVLPRLGAAAKALLRPAVSGAPLIVKFHSDGDGATGAIALHKALLKVQQALGCEIDVKWLPIRGIAYTMDGFYYDSMHFRNYESVEKPVVCIMDFGTTEESNEAVAAASGIFDFVWLDHHPITGEFTGSSLPNYVNPVSLGGRSDFTAGYLAGLFAQVIADVRVEELKEASLISDFSAYATHRNHEAVKYATILDFVTGIKNSTHYLDGPVTPSYLLKLITDKEKLDSTYSYATGMIEDAIGIGIERAKSYRRKDGITINVIDFVHIAEKYGGYLLPGRYSSKVQGRLDEQHERGAVTIVNFRNAISIRVSKRIAERIGLPAIIDRLKASTDMIVSGGGHREASSVIATEGSSERVIRLLLKELQV